MKDYPPKIIQFQAVCARSTLTLIVLAVAAGYGLGFLS